MIRLMILIAAATEIWAGWSYRVFSPIWGEMGRLHLQRQEPSGRYRIEAQAVTSGFAAFVTGNRRERYRSEGVRIGDRYLSRRFFAERWMKKKHQIEEYRIDPGRRRVFKHRLRWKNGTLKKDLNDILDYYTETDLMALYHNLIPRVLRAPPGTRWRPRAVGAEKINGTFVVERPGPRRAAAEKKRLGAASDTTVVILRSPEKILGKRNRELILILDNAGTVQKGRLSPLPIVGELLIQRLPE